MFYFWTKGSKTSKISLFQISKLFLVCVYLCVYCPKKINSHLLFVQLFLVTDSVPYLHWVGGLGSCTGPFFSVVMFCWVHAHTCSCPRLKKRIRQTQSSCLKSTCVVGNCRFGSTPGRPRTV